MGKWRFNTPVLLTKEELRLVTDLAGEKSVSEYLTDIVLTHIKEPPNQEVANVCAICGASPANYTNGKESLCSTHKRSSTQR